MNREQKRKEAKKNKKINVENKEVDTKKELYRLLKIALIVVIIFAILYLVVGILVTKEIELFKDKEDDVAENTTSNAILANSVFDQKEEEYYVYFYDFNNENTTVATSIVNTQNISTIYRVDTSDVLNKNYVVEVGSNKEAKKLDELKVVKDTIIKVSGDEIVAYYEGEEEIKNNLY